MKKDIKIKRGKVEEKEGVTFDGKKAKIVISTNLAELISILKDAGFEVKFYGFNEDEIPKEVVTLKSIIEEIKKKGDQCGAIGIFVGFVRSVSRGKKVLRLEYERFEELYERKLKEIEKKLKSYPGVIDVKIYHKTGTIKPKEDIVYVVVMGKHRKNVWEPLKDGIELVKKELPIWKKEVYENGEVWVHDVELK
ncbi:molybdenum cofactor biosynthesis protein MoaE [Candidatus Bathyarchaeota archaeon]|nr:MAG: molybdenum cofactor biosynthesis protein MoaE [Candidatus Bathyarchaeota archaeon]